MYYRRCFVQKFSSFKGDKYDIQNINIAANNYLLCKDVVE